MRTPTPTLMLMRPPMLKRRLRLRPRFAYSLFAAIISCCLCSCLSVLRPALRTDDKTAKGVAQKPDEGAKTLPGSKIGKTPEQAPLAPDTQGRPKGPRPADVYEYNALRDGVLGLVKGLSGSSAPGSRVLAAAKSRIERGIILRGSCYDFVNAVYLEAGYGPRLRRSVFSSKAKGPYADPALLERGDWVQYTHMYSDTQEHSVIFISWLDFEQRIALVADYAGNSKNEAGRYRVADLYKVWGLVRAATQ